VPDTLHRIAEATGGLDRDGANFGEYSKGEVRRTPLLGTSVKFSKEIAPVRGEEGPGSVSLRVAYVQAAYPEASREGRKVI
jgi:hypothetical protein